MGRARRAHASCCALALAALSLLSSSARAESAGIPPECGSRARFDAELKQRLGQDAPVDSVHVSIDQAPGGFHLRVQIGSELRELDDESCTELLRAAVVVAVAMLMRDRTPPDAQPQPTPPPAAPTSTPRPRLTLAIGAGATAGILPRPVFGVELESKALWRHFGVGLAVRYLAPGEKRDPDGRGVRLHAFGAGVTGIFKASRTWEARVGLAAQRLSGEGLSAEVPTFDPQQDSAWTAGPTLGLGFVPFEQPPFWLGLGAEGQLNLLRARFRFLNHDGDIYKVPWLAGAGFVRLGLVW